MSILGALGNAVGKAMRNSWLTQLLNNTKWNNDRINGDNAQGTGAGGHTHEGGGTGAALTMAAFDFSESSSEGESTDGIGAFVQKLRHTFTPPTGGDYIIQYNFEVTNANGAGRTEIQIDLDEGTILGTCVCQPATANDYKLDSGFSINTVTAAAHTVDIDFRKLAGGDAKIRRARIATWRVD